MVKSRLYDKTVVNFSLKFVPILAKIAVCVFNFTKEGEFLV